MGFEEFLHARLPALLRYALVLTGDRHRAEDIVQDVLVRAERRWRRIGRMDAPEAYLKKMITNEYLSWRRRRSSREVPVADSALRALGGTVADHGAAIGDRELVRAGIAALPPRQRVAVALRFYEDLSYADMAKIMDCAEATARSLVHRALSGLRAALAAERVEGL